MINKNQLKKRGRSPALILKFLPENNDYYSITTVENIEQTEAFKAEMQKTVLRRTTAKKSLMLSRELLDIMRKNNFGM